MYLLLTIVSVLAAWAFLTLLVVGLLLILKPLEAIRAHLQRIAAGVRAIERETAPLLDLTARLPAAAATVADSLRPLAQRIYQLDHGVDRNHRALQRLRRH
jgi:phosphate uptake regulator